MSRRGIGMTGFRFAVCCRPGGLKSIRPRSRSTWGQRSDRIAPLRAPVYSPRRMNSGRYTTERAIRAARAQGKGILKIAREVGVGTATVQRVLGDL